MNSPTKSVVVEAPSTNNLNSGDDWGEFSRASPSRVNGSNLSPGLSPVL